MNEEIINEVPQQPTTADLAFLKDLGDVVRTRNIFFIPFFGAFLTFLLTKIDYVKNAGLVIDVELAVTFFLGILYAVIFPNFLWTLETLRFLHGININSKSVFFSQFSDTQRSAVAGIMQTVPPNVTWERRVFRWTMNSLWISTGSVLLDIYFGEFNRAWLGRLVRYVLH